MRCNVWLIALCQVPSEDRNRTSPFPYGGHRFEFRAVGSSQVEALAHCLPYAFALQTPSCTRYGLTWCLHLHFHRTYHWWTLCWPPSLPRPSRTSQTPSRRAPPLKQWHRRPLKRAGRSVSYTNTSSTHTYMTCITTNHKTLPSFDHCLRRWSSTVTATIRIARSN